MRSGNAELPYGERLLEGVRESGVDDEVCWYSEDW